MSIFGSILSKLGMGDKKPEVKPAAPAAAPAAPVAPAVPAAAAPVVAAVAAMSGTDVMAHLESLMAKHAEKLNWQGSIVDLLSEVLHFVIVDPIFPVSSSQPL